jgi:hypothetical protein
MLQILLADRNPSGAIFTNQMLCIHIPAARRVKLPSRGVAS